jgi:hypothetical protein
MNKWIAVVVLDLMVLTAAVGLRAVTTRAGQTASTRAAAAKILGGPVPW